MANTKISDFASGAPAQATDEFVIARSGANYKLAASDIQTLVNTPGGSDTQVQFNDGGAFGGDAGLTFNKTSKALTLGGATVTTSQPVIDASQTWNASGVTFTGLKFNAATGSSANSAAGSLLMDLQLEGTSQFSVAKNGAVQFKAAGAIETYVRGRAGGAFTVYSSGNVAFFDAQNGGISVRNVAVIGFSTNSDVTTAGADAMLTRRAAANLRLGAADAASPVAQTLSVQSVAAGQTNVAGANLTITGSQGTGTGAGGSIIFQVAPAGSSGTAQNALATAWSIDSSSRLIGASGGTAAAPAVSLPNNTGLAAPATNILVFSVSGVDRARLESQLGFGLARDSWLWWSANQTNTAYSNRDTVLARDAANTLALRNGANAQAFRVYNTYTSDTDFERANIFWDSNVLKIGTEKGSAGGTARALEFQTDGVTRVTIATSGAVSFGANANVDASGNLTLLGFMSITGVAYYRSNIEIRNKANNGWVGFATRNTSGSEVVFDLTNVGSITASGDLTISTKNIVTDGTTGTKIGTATSQKIGFWNATPIVQPTTGVTAATFVANTSGITDDTATFDGYTIGQVVAALRSAGLLA